MTCLITRLKLFGRKCLHGALLAASIMLLAPRAGAGAEGQTRLIFAGSGTNLPIVRVLAKEFQKSRPNVSIQVPASIGSTSAVRAAADGAVALGLISRPLKESEKGLALTTVDFARTPLIVGVHPSVPDDGITFAELVDIYRGEKSRWGNGRDIVVLTREPGDSSIEVLARMVPGFREVYDESQKSKRWTTLLKDLAMNETLARTPDAIGLSDLGAVTIEKHVIRPLKVNGAAPSLGNLRNGKYPLFKTLTFVYREERLAPEARLFMDFVRSGKGEKILKANGYLHMR